ncbi:hypothetical protein HaLaN_25446, partial [Haematococcus lacustris]
MELHGAADASKVEYAQLGEAVARQARSVWELQGLLAQASVSEDGRLLRLSLRDNMMSLPPELGSLAQAQLDALSFSAVATAPKQAPQPLPDLAAPPPASPRYPSTKATAMLITLPWPAAAAAPPPPAGDAAAAPSPPAQVQQPLSMTSAPPLLYPPSTSAPATAPLQGLTPRMAGAAGAAATGAAKEDEEQEQQMTAGKAAGTAAAVEPALVAAGMAAAAGAALVKVTSAATDVLVAQELSRP